MVLSTAGKLVIEVPFGVPHTSFYPTELRKALDTIRKRWTKNAGTVPKEKELATSTILEVNASHILGIIPVGLAVPSIRINGNAVAVSPR